MKTRNKIILSVVTIITVIMSMVTTASAAQVSNIPNQANYKDKYNVNEIDIITGANNGTLSNKTITIRPQTSFYLSASATGQYTKYTPVGIQTTSTVAPIVYYGTMQNTGIGNGAIDGHSFKIASIRRGYWMYEQGATDAKTIQGVTFKTGTIYTIGDKRDDISYGNVPAYTLNIRIDKPNAQIGMNVYTTVFYEELNKDEKAYITKSKTFSSYSTITGTGLFEDIRIVPQIRGIYSYETENSRMLKITSMETEITFAPADLNLIGETYLDSIFIESPFQTFNDMGYLYNRDLPGMEAEEIIKEVIVSPQVDFTEWIVDAVGGFMDMEIYPGLSVGATFATVGGLALLMMVLKMIAGG